ICAESATKTILLLRTNLSRNVEQLLITPTERTNITLQACIFSLKSGKPLSFQSESLKTLRHQNLIKTRLETRLETSLKMADPDSKRCSSCEGLKPISDFTRGNGKSAVLKTCAACRSKVRSLYE